jgi:hypothetical protein
LDERADELSRLIRTLPPAEFLSLFHSVYSECDRLLTRVLENPEEQTLDNVKAIIRAVLYGVATLAKKFDGSPSGAEYGVNIMLFTPSDSLARLNEGDRDSLQQRLRFCESETDMTALAGVLDLRLDLSTSTQTGADSPDTVLVPLALPVPREIYGKDKKRRRVVPGAPLAFCEGTLSGFDDLRSLAQWCRDEGDFSQSVILEMEQYFNETARPWIRSFISIPLSSPSDDRPKRGVLNIHSNKTGLLQEKEPSAHFVPLLRPFQSILLRLLVMLITLEGKQAPS